MERRRGVRSLLLPASFKRLTRLKDSRSSHNRRCSAEQKSSFLKSAMPRRFPQYRHPPGFIGSRV